MLFRSEVLEFRKTLGNGQIIRLPDYFPLAFFTELLMVSLIASFLVFGHYTRKETMDGKLARISLGPNWALNMLESFRA